MGQGLYTMLGFGVVNPPVPTLPSGKYWNGWEASLDTHKRPFSFRLCEEYESEPGYLVVPLAVSDGCLALKWDVPKRNRFAVTAATVSRLADLSIHRLQELRRQWSQVKKRAKEVLNIDMPDGELVLVNDWD